MHARASCRPLATGADTREIARRMFLSEHTVQDHLKSIFAKTSAHSRRTLLSLALGGSCGGPLTWGNRLDIVLTMLANLIAIG